MLKRMILANRYVVGCLLLVIATPVYADNLSMRVITSRRTNRQNNVWINAAAGNGFPIAIYVLVTNPATGEGITDLTPEKPGQTIGNWTTDLDLPKTNWTCWQEVPEPGPRMRILRITNVGDGLYKFDVVPVIGRKGGLKSASTWVKGDYIFHIGYSKKRGTEKTDYGRVLGTLTID